MFGLSPERILTLVIAITVHEFAHAWTADQMGDDTPRLQGRLTLNPLSHLDPIGSLMLLFAGFGWGRPVMVNPYAVRRRTPAGMMLVAAAGPFSNLILAILASIPFRLGVISLGVSNSIVVSFFFDFILINLALLFFNLIPIFPLDGEKIAEYFLPPAGQDFLYRIRPYSPFILLALVLLGNFGPFNLLGYLIGTPVNKLIELLIF